MAPVKLSERVLAGPLLRMQPDRRLAALAAGGSEAATEEIVRRYRPALVRYAATIVPPHRAEDVVQEAFARTLRRLASGGEELAIRPWLYTVVRNAALNDLRDAPPPQEPIDESYDGVEQPPQALERRERVRLLVARLGELPDAQREALVKREMEGRGHAEIAAQLGVSEGAARQLIFRARASVRDALGCLVPMPLLRYLFESGDGSAAAVGAAGSGALAAKAAIAILATGAVVGAGVGAHRADRADRALAERPAPTRSAAPDHHGHVPAHAAHRRAAAASAGGGVANEAGPHAEPTFDASLDGQRSGGGGDRRGPGHDGSPDVHAGSGGGGPSGQSGSDSSTPSGEDRRGSDSSGDRSGGGLEDNSGPGSIDSSSSGSGDSTSSGGSDSRGPGGGKDGAPSGGSGGDGSTPSGSGGSGSGDTTLSGGSDGSGSGSSGSGSDGGSTSGASGSGSGGELSSSGDGSDDGSRDPSSFDGLSATTDQPSAG
jgi:RNA polymerase sigma factor (sigma-70 family)